MQQLKKTKNVNDENIIRTTKTLYGNDIDDESTDILKIRLFIYVYSLLEKITIWNAYYCEIDTKHEMLVSERTKKVFIEMHHLFPVMYQQENGINMKLMWIV